MFVSKNLKSHQGINGEEISFREEVVHVYAYSLFQNLFKYYVIFSYQFR